MKCPKCSHNHKKKEGPICSACQYRFIFQYPNADYKLTDGAFSAILTKVSANSSRYFLTRHVQTAIATRPKSLLSHIFITLFLIVWVTGFFGAILQGLSGSPIFFYILPFAVVTISFYHYKRGPQWPKSEEVLQWLRAWETRFGPLEYWISTPSLDKAPSSHEESEADLTVYGVQKILIVDDDLLVDALVRNNWHTDQQTLVISATGYPASALTLANRYLSENPNMTVYLYHSSAWNDFTAHVHSEGKLLLNEHKVIALGISPDMVKHSKMFKKYYKNVPGGVVRGDQIPINTWQNVMTACVVSGVLMTEAFSSYSASSAASFESDFG